MYQKFSRANTPTTSASVFFPKSEKLCLGTLALEKPSATRSLSAR
jgi:hypothetical protein